MFNKKLTNIQKLTISALCMALYVVVMMTTQSFAFGQYQIRIATAIYGLSAIFPFLIIPLGIANLISNTIMGGLGPLDMIGGALVGFLTCTCIVLVKKSRLPNYLIAVAITLVPGLCVPIWLSILLNIPYMILMPALVIGQITPGIVGYIATIALENVLNPKQMQQPLIGKHKEG